MPLRKFVFWVHLACGVGAGLVILTMSVTGVLLTYEKQMVQWSDREYWVAQPAPRTDAPLNVVIANARAHDPEARVAAVVVYADPDAPISATLSGGRILYLDPSTGLVRGENTRSMRAFFAGVKGWHRWLSVEGDARNGARAITGWSNLVFLFMVISGLYLWVPKHLSWRHLRPILLYNPKATGKARDFNWHHVFGFWLSLPLALVIASASFISFTWVSDWALERVSTEAAVIPVRNVSQSSVIPIPGTIEGPATLDQLLEVARTRIPGWRTVSINLLTPPDDPVQFLIDRGWGGEPRQQSTLTLARDNAREVSYEPHDAQPAGRRLRLFFRYAHTGEYFGLLGQSVAGLASLAGIVLVWSGFALAWRRLARTLRRNLKQRRSAVTGPSGSTPGS